MGRGFSHITRIPLGVALLLSAVVLCGWIPSFRSDWQTVLPTFLLVLLNATLFFVSTTPLPSRQKEDGLPLLLYVLSATAFPALHTCWQAQLGVACMLPVMHLLRHEQSEEFSPEYAFLCTLTLSFASLFVVDFVWFIPALWVCMLFSRDFNFRTLSATLIAGGAFALYLCIAIFLFGADTGYAHLFDRTLYYTVGTVFHALPVFGAMGLFFIFALLLSLERNSLRWRMEVIFLVLFAIAAAVLCLFPVVYSAPAYCAFHPAVISSESSLYLSSMLPVALALQTHLACLYFRQYATTTRSVFFLIYSACFVVTYIGSWFF